MITVIVNLLHQFFCFHPERPIYRVRDGVKHLECTRCFKQYPGAFEQTQFTPSQESGHVLSYGVVVR